MNRLEPARRQPTVGVQEHQDRAGGRRGAPPKLLAATRMKLNEPERAMLKASAEVVRKGIEDRLRDREQRLAMVVETAASGIITADAAGVIVSANPAIVLVIRYLNC